MLRCNYLPLRLNYMWPSHFSIWDATVLALCVAHA